MPILDGAVAWVDLRIARAAIPAAITRSRSATCSTVGADGGDPLVFFGGAYRPLD